MSGRLCFGTFFTLLCYNKKDWDKKRKPAVTNRILYAALLDIADKRSPANHHVNIANSKYPDTEHDETGRQPFSDERTRIGRCLA